MSYHQIKKLAVVTFSNERVTGVVFRRSKEGLEPLVSVSEAISPEDPSIAWKSVLRQMGRGRDCPLYLAGSLEGGICFDVQLADLPSNLQRQALELELPRHLLKVPAKMRFQFIPITEPADGSVTLRVYAVPGQSFERIAAMLTQGSSRADGFLYPALAIQNDDPPFQAPEMEKNLYFSDGKWSPLPLPEGAMAQWHRKISDLLISGKSAAAEMETILLPALAANFLMEQAAHPGLNILPDRLRPKRVRNQLKATAVLVILLILSGILGSAGDWKNRFLEMRSLERETKALVQENAGLKRKIKSKEKAQKELIRLVNLKAGERELPGKFADLSAAIPDSVLVTSMRWNENGVEFQMQSSSGANISNAIRTLPYWKIGQLQQRRWGNSQSTMITLRLVPAETAK